MVQSALLRWFMACYFASFALLVGNGVFADDCPTCTPVASGTASWHADEGCDGFCGGCHARQSNAPWGSCQGPTCPCHQHVLAGQALVPLPALFVRWLDPAPTPRLDMGLVFDILHVPILLA